MIQLKDPRISIFVNADSTTIEIQDALSSTVIMELELTPEQFCQALSRLHMTKCKAEINEHSFEKINKKLITGTHEFEVPERRFQDKEYEEEVYKIACQTAPEGWTCQNYFNSQNCYFKKGEKQYARCTIRRWD